MEFVLKNISKSYSFGLLFSIYQWLILFPLIFIITNSVGIIIIINSYTKRSKYLNQKLGTWWGKLILFFSFVKLDTLGLENIEEKKSYVIIANHLSVFDIFVMYSFIETDFIILIKKEIRKIPIFGFICDRFGHIYINREGGKEAVISFNRGKVGIKEGRSIFFFPEGTRSKNGKIGNFKIGAFKMAVETGLPILPITIYGTQNILKSGSFRIKPGLVKVKIHKEIKIENLENDRASMLNLRDIAKKVISN